MLTGEEKERRDLVKLEKIKNIRYVGKARCYDISLDGEEKGFFANDILVHNSDFSLADSVETFEDGRMFKKKYPEVTKIAIGLEGQVRNCGVHAAAIILSSEDLRLGQRSSLKCGKEKELVVNWDKYDIEHFGLMKLDILGLNALTILNETKKMIERSTGEAFDLFSIPLDDKKVLDNFTKGDCIGIFQFSSLGLRKLCRNLIIDNFDLLVAANALHRPGTIRSGMMTHFIDRKRGREKWTYLHPFLEAITKETYGIILYQEQVMRFMYDLGGLPWRTADTVRKVISKSQGVEQFLKFKQLFAEGCVEKKTLSREVAEKLWEELSSFGCLDGETKLYRASSNQHKDNKIKIKELYRYQSSDNFKHRKLKILAMSDDGFIRPHTVNKIWKTGKKSVFLLTTISNKAIKASKDHRFLTEKGWRSLGDLKIGDIIKCTDFLIPEKKIPWIGSGSYLGKSNKLRKGLGKTPEFFENRKILFEKFEGSCQECGSDRFVEIHHLDFDKENNDISNLVLICRKCHKNAHPREIYKRFQVGYFSTFEEIACIKYLGERETYDLEMEGSPNNFVANSFIVHNSYSFNKAHSVEYTLIGFWQMYLKTYYFKEFMCCSLSFGADGKKEDLVEECFAKDITISAPKVGISKDLEWRFKDDVLYMPFKEIKGIGDASAKKLSEMTRDGFFKGKYKLSPKINSLLTKLKAFEDDLLTEEEILECSEFFPFSINKDKSFRYKKFVEKIEEATSVNTLSELTKIKERTDILLLGTMTEIKFGYRGKIDTIEKKLGISGIAGNLGGVYGNFRDSSDFMMLVFDAGIYNRKKYKVEHCSKKFLLAKINVISRTTDFNIMCNDAWFEDEILSCELDGLGVDFRKKKRFKNNDLLSCELCDLRAECSAPVLPSLGIYNIMIVAEAPGKTENVKGKGLVGASGDILWRELSSYGHNRSEFHTTNVVKCFPSVSKTPSHKQIKSCSKWLDEEIKILEPPMILAIGNVALKYFTGEDSGIMAKNGTTEWIEKFGCWVSWCIHPASVLYHRENMEIFSKGIKNFAEKLGTISQAKEEK